MAEHRLHPPKVHELAELDLPAHGSGELAGPLADLGEQACLQILLLLGSLSIIWVTFDYCVSIELTSAAFACWPLPCFSSPLSLFSSAARLQRAARKSGSLS